MDSKGHVLSDKCIADEVPFEVPESWEWARLGEVGDWKAGATPSKSKPEYYINGTIPWLLTGDLNDGVINQIPKYITELALQECPLRLNPIGSILVAMYGATIGKIGVLSRAATTNQACCACILHDEVIRDWLVTWLLFYRPFFMELGIGGAQPNISRGIIVSSLLPIPPLAEQHRIVERVEELMPLVEEYGRLEDAREKLDAALPDQLRKSVLQEAVRGKLVPQDPADEPASALLERVRAERRRLVKEKKAKLPKGGESVIYVGSDGGHYEKRLDAKGRVLSDECIEDEIPFDVPEGWTWARLPSVADLRIGKTPSRHEPKYWENGDVSWFSISDMQDGATVRSTKESVSGAALRDCFKTGTVPAGTLLMSFKLTIGRTCVAGIDCVHNEAIVSITPVVDKHDSIRDYLLRFLPLISQAGDTKGAIKGATLNSKSLAALLVPLPPLAEQRRIVKRLEEICSLIS